MLNSQYAIDVAIENYTPSPPIHGVHIVPLKKFRDLNGSFMEYMRLNSDGTLGGNESFQPRQISVSHADPGRVNAFHIHHKETQDEFWTVVSGSLLVHLVDLRVDSETYENMQSVLLSGESPVMLYIPTGVAHGYKAGQDGATLIYCMNSQFNIEDPNEGRLPWNYFGAKIWEDNKG